MEPTSTLRALICGSLLLLPLACTGDDAMLTSDTSASSGGAPATTSGPDLTATSTTGTTAATSVDDTGTTSPIPDVASDGSCDVFAQDCPTGTKCMPWANDGGTSWNEWRCFPVAEDPAGVGEPCHLLGGPDNPLSGLDDCEVGAMCFNVDLETLEGTCFPFCVGSDREPTCADADRYCAIEGDGTPYLCAPSCDPLAPNCPAQQVCLPDGLWWTCAPDGSGDMGAYGDPCDFLNECDPGLVCQGSSALPPGLPCDGATDCCTELCDLSDPLGDAQCTGAAEGQACESWYGPGQAPAPYENLGVCALP